MQKKAPKKAAKKAALKEKSTKKASKRVVTKTTTPKRVAKKAAKKVSSGLAYKGISGKRVRFAVSKKKRVYNDALINKATFLHKNVLSITFTDGHVQEVDFSNFLNSESTPPYIREYKQESKFKKFKIEDGNLVWGKDWDLIFPIPQLYEGKIK